MTKLGRTASLIADWNQEKNSPQPPCLQSYIQHLCYISCIAFTFICNYVACVCVYEIVLLELQIFTFNSFSLVRYPAPLCPLSTPLLDLQLHELCQQTSAFLLGSVSGKHKQETGGREKYELRVLTSLVMRSTRTGCSPDSWSLILLILSSLQSLGSQFPRPLAPQVHLRLLYRQLSEHWPWVPALFLRLPTHWPHFIISPFVNKPSLNFPILSVPSVSCLRLIHIPLFIIVNP